MAVTTHKMRLTPKHAAFPGTKPPKIEAPAETMKKAEEAKKSEAKKIQEEIEERMTLSYAIKNLPELAMSINRISDSLFPSEIFSFIVKDVASEGVTNLFQLHTERKAKMDSLKEQEKEIKKSLIKSPPIIGPLLSTIFKAFIPGTRGFEARQKIKSFIYKPADTILSVAWDNNRLRILAELKRTKGITEKGLKKLEENQKLLIEKTNNEIDNLLYSNGFKDRNHFLGILKEFEELILKKEKTPEEHKEMLAILEKIESTYPQLINVYEDFINKRSQNISKYTGKILKKYGFNVYAKSYHV